MKIVCIATDAQPGANVNLSRTIVQCLFTSRKPYVSLDYSAGDFPGTESAAAEIVVLPMYSQLTSAQQENMAVEVALLSTTVLRYPADMEAGRLIPAEPLITLR